MAEILKLLPTDIDIRSGLIDMPVHIVARSVARSIVQYGRATNSWPVVTARTLSEQPFCHESASLVAIMLEELANKGLLERLPGDSYGVTGTFVFHCRALPDPSSGSS